MRCRRHVLSGLMAAAGLLGSLVVSQAQAQQAGGYDQSWYLAPVISAFDPDNDYRIGGTGVGGGLRLGKQLAPNIDLQLMANHARRSEAGNNVQQTLLGVDGLYVFSRSALQPFVFLGAGAERDKRSLTGLGTSSTSPYVNAGLGLRWMLSNNFGLTAEYRRVEGFLRKSTWGFRDSGNNYFNLGLQWNFGADRPAPRIAAAAPVAPAAPIPVAPPSPPPAPQPPPAPKVAPPPPPPPPPQRMTLEASRLFAFDSARLMTPIPELDTFAEALQNNPQISSVTITGHTDQMGTAAYNRALSQRRADAVKAYLVGKGVAANRLTAQGMGSTKLVKECDLRKRAEAVACGAPNRRVEVEPITVPKK